MFYKVSRLFALSVFTALIIIPSLVVVFGSFKSDLEIYDRPVAPPIDWTIANYQRLFRDSNIETSFMNSVTVTLSSVVLTLMLASFASFGIARIVHASGKFLFALFSLGLAIPAATSIIAIFELFVRFNLTNSLPGLVMINIASTLPVSIFILTAFFRQIPNELYESASIDGASAFRLYRSIALPLSRPSMSAVAIFLFVIIWNDLLYPLLLITQQDKKTLPLSMLDYRGEYSTSFSMIFTAVMVASLPMIIMYVMMQRSFVAGLTAGAVKG